MIAFSYRSFRNHLEGNLSKEEIRFLIRTFGYAAMYFALVGVGVFVLHILFFEVIKWSGWAGYSLFSIIGFLLCLPLHFFSVRYRNNPLRAPSSFVSVCFLMLTISFIFVFLGLTGILHKICVETSAADAGNGRSFVGGAILAIMGSSAVIYSIPAVFAWFIQKNKKMVVKLNKFLNICYLTYLFVFIITILSLCLGFGISGIFKILALVALTAIIFCGPVLTIYRLKTVAYYINHDDDCERKKWENYFAFEISFQLLKIAFCVLKILILLLGRARTRLR